MEPPTVVPVATATEAETLSAAAIAFAASLVVPPDGGVVVDVVAESVPASAAALPEVMSRAEVAESSPASAEIALALTPVLRQAPHPAQGPRGQSPVGGSPDVVVATARAVVVLVSAGLDCDRSQMPSLLVSTYLRQAPGYGSFTNPLGQLSQARALVGKTTPYPIPNKARLKMVARTAIFLFRLLMYPNPRFTGGPHIVRSPVLLGWRLEASALIDIPNRSLGAVWCP